MRTNQIVIRNYTMQRDEMPMQPGCKSNDENSPTETDACYEVLASQEEIYLEETEEAARARFIAYDELESRNGY
jgi:hypothetical protein